MESTPVFSRAPSPLQRAGHPGGAAPGELSAWTATGEPHPATFDAGAGSTRREAQGALTSPIARDRDGRFVRSSGGVSRGSSRRPNERINFSQKKRRTGALRSSAGSGARRRGSGSGSAQAASGVAMRHSASAPGLPRSRADVRGTRMPVSPVVEGLAGGRGDELDWSPPADTQLAHPVQQQHYFGGGTLKAPSPSNRRVAPPRASFLKPLPHDDAGGDPFAAGGTSGTRDAASPMAGGQSRDGETRLQTPSHGVETGVHGNPFASRTPTHQVLPPAGLRQHRWARREQELKQSRGQAVHGVDGPDEEGRLRYLLREAAADEQDLFREMDGQLAHMLDTALSREGMKGSAVDVPRVLVTAQTVRPQATSSDISFLGDSLHQRSGKVPETLIPVEDHLFEEHAVRPPDLSDASFDTTARKWRVRVFPSLRPTSRAEVRLLKQWMEFRSVDPSPAVDIAAAKANEYAEASAQVVALRTGPATGSPGSPSVPNDEALAQLRASADGTANMALEQTRASEFVLSAGFNEVVRQVSTVCGERGALVALIGKKYLELFDKLAQLNRPLRDGVSTMQETCLHQQAQLKSSKLRLSAMQEVADEAQDELHGTKHALSGVREEYNKMSEKYKKETHRLRMLARGKGYDPDFHVSEIDRLAKELGDSHEEVGMLQEFKTKLQDELDTAVFERDKIEAELAEQVDLTDRLQYEMDHLGGNSPEAILGVKLAQELQYLRKQFRKVEEKLVKGGAIAPRAQGADPETPKSKKEIALVRAAKKAERKSMWTKFAKQSKTLKQKARKKAMQTKRNKDSDAGNGAAPTHVELSVTGSKVETSQAGSKISSKRPAKGNRASRLRRRSITLGEDGSLQLDVDSVPAGVAGELGDSIESPGPDVDPTVSETKGHEDCDSSEKVHDEDASDPEDADADPRKRRKELRTKRRKIKAQVNRMRRLSVVLKANAAAHDAMAANGSDDAEGDGDGQAAGAEMYDSALEKVRSRKVRLEDKLKQVADREAAMKQIESHFNDGTEIPDELADHLFDADVSSDSDDSDPEDNSDDTNKQVAQQVKLLAKAAEQADAMEAGGNTILGDDDAHSTSGSLSSETDSDADPDVLESDAVQELMGVLDRLQGEVQEKNEALLLGVTRADVETAEVGTQTMDDKKTKRRRNAREVLKQSLAGLDIDVPPYWRNFLKGLKLTASDGVRVWRLSRLRAFILECYLERIKRGNQGEEAELSKLHNMQPLVLDFMLAKYGVKRLVQLKLRELLFSISKYKSDLRVEFFARAVACFRPFTKHQVLRMIRALKVTLVGVMQVQTAESASKSWLTSNDGSNWFPRGAASKAIDQIFVDYPTAKSASLKRLPGLRRMGDASAASTAKGGRAAKIMAAAMQTKAKRASGGTTDYVDIDSFLQLVMREYAVLESIVVDQWKLIFAEVDDDDNQVLDLEEFVEAIARIDQIPKFPEGQVRALFLDSLQDQETQFIDEGQFVEIVNRLAETSLPPPEESSFGETARPSTPSLTALDSFAITKNSIADIQQDIRDKDMELTEFEETWKDIEFQVKDQANSPYQNPAIRLLLQHKAAMIEAILAKLRKDIRGAEEELPSSSIVLTEEHLVEVNELSMSGAWSKFRDLVKDVQRAVRNRRQRAMRTMQVVVRGWLARRHWKKVRNAAMLLQIVVRRWRDNREVEQAATAD